MPWMSRPPIVGPSVGASTIGTAIRLITRPIWALEDCAVQIIVPTGMIAPPPTPCSAREAISIPTLCEHAHSTEPTVNTASAATYNRAVPNRRAAQPVTGMTAASARR